jgi:hypothetical protein
MTFTVVSVLLLQYGFICYSGALEVSVVSIYVYAKSLYSLPALLLARHCETKLLGETNRPMHVNVLSWRNVDMSTKFV